MCAWSVCMYRNSIFVSFVVSYFNLCFIGMHVCFHLSKIRLLNFVWALKTLQLYCWQLSFVIPSGVHIGSYFCSHKPTYQDPTGLVVRTGCTGASTLSQAKIYRPECSAQVAPHSEKSHCTFASQYLDSQHLYRLEVSDIKAALTSKWYMLGIVRNIVLAL